MQINKNFFDDYKTIYIQWHITARCNYSCKHCYMPDDKTYISEIENELSSEICFLLADGLFKLAEKAKKPLYIVLTGGDPLLRNDFFDIISYLRKKEKEKGVKTRIGFMGTPRTLTSEILKNAKEYNIRNIQLSIDGLEEKHDEMRGKGAFSELEEAVRLVKSYSIPLAMMFTLGKENKDQFIPLMRWTAEKEVDRFTFSRLVPIGSASNSDEEFTPQEFKDFLLEVLEETYKLDREGKTTFYPQKEPLWELLYSAYGRETSRSIDCCCAVGDLSLTILADGTILPCRRLPIILGKFPEDDIIEIAYNSPEMLKFRDISNYKKCSTCNLFKKCRGCMCVSYALTGDPFSPDPLCWK